MRDFSFFSDYIYIKGTMAKVIANTKIILKRGKMPKLTAAKPRLIITVPMELSI